MGDDKKFLKGVMAGIILVLAINIIINGGLAVFGKFWGPERDTRKKLMEIKSVIDNYYVNEVDYEKLEDGMFEGYVSGLNDRYSYYMNKESFESFIQDTEGTYTGIGIVVELDKNSGRLTIISEYDDAAGQQAGLRVGDQILKIDGKSVGAENFGDAVGMMRGEEGSTVKLSIYRPSANSSFDVDIKRENVDIPTVNSSMLEDNIGYIRILKFDRVTYNQYAAAFNELQKNGMERLIIDLRDNPGGLLDTVVKIADTLVPEGIITYIEDKNGKKTYEYSGKEFMNKPLVVLVNGHSASASEVLAGAIKDYGVGKLLGTTTFGKGVVQNIYKLSDGSGVKVTIAKYYTPKGICIHGTGIKPDYVIESPQTETEDFLPADISFEDDIQLQNAIRVVKEM